MRKLIMEPVSGGVFSAFCCKLFVEHVWRHFSSFSSFNSLIPPTGRQTSTRKLIKRKLTDVFLCVSFFFFFGKIKKYFPQLLNVGVWGLPFSWAQSGFLLGTSEWKVKFGIYLLRVQHKHTNSRLVYSCLPLTMTSLSSWAWGLGPRSAERCSAWLSTDCRYSRSDVLGT